MQKEVRLGMSVRLGVSSVVVAYRGRRGERYVAGDLGLGPGARRLIAGSWQQSGLCRSLSLIESGRSSVDVGRRSLQEELSSVSIGSRRQSRCQGDDRSLKKGRGMMQARFVSAWPCDDPR